jgi:hypothetical protein
LIVTITIALLEVLPLLSRVR